MFACGAKPDSESDSEKADVTEESKYIITASSANYASLSRAAVIPSTPKPWQNEDLPFSERLLLALKDGDSTLLRAAIAKGDILDLLAIRTAADETLLHICALHGNVEAATILCQAMIPTGQPTYINLRTIDNEAAMHTALTTNNIPVANLLLLCGADPFQVNAYAETSFYLACYSGYLEFVKVILRTRCADFKHS